MSADRLSVEMVRLLAEELHAAPAPPVSRAVPTVADFLPRVLAAATPATRASYGPAWRRAREFFGHKRLDEIAPSDVLALHQHVITAARGRGGRAGGRAAGETALRAMRRLFRLAVADGWVDRDADPAARVPLPRRRPSPRRALTAAEVAAINQVVATGGRDVALDTLLIRLHLETACRRGGALGLRLADLDRDSCAVFLREKGGTRRWQPVTPRLVAALREHAQARGACQPGDALLRHADGRPLSARHYTALWARVRGELPWAAALGVSAHWLRHTTITWVERRFGYGIARAYAGHTDAKGASTTTYIRGQFREIATALSELTGQPHPLAPAPPTAADIGGPGQHEPRASP